MNVTADKDKLRTALWRMVVGAIVGGSVTALFLLAFQPRLDFADPGNTLATIAGISYALIGLSVGFGVIAPRAGARFLNVEDAEELREEGPKLTTGAIVCFLVGVFLLVLALAGNSEAAVYVAGACLAGIVVVSLLGKRPDEMTRQIGLEASASTLHIALVMFGGWAALATFGFVAWASPLVFISSLALLELIAIFAVSAKKGLLMR